MSAVFLVDPDVKQDDPVLTLPPQYPRCQACADALLAGRAAVCACVRPEHTVTCSDA